MTQRILNVGPSSPLEIRVEETVVLDRALVLPEKKVVPFIPPLVDQEQTGTCVAHAAYILYGHAYKRKYGHFPPITEKSILAFYDLCKKVDHDPDPGRSHGTTLLTALRTMAGSGFPFDDGTRGPRITGYEYVGDDYNDVKLALAQFDTPVLFRLNWDANWMYLPTSKIVKPPVGQIIGGHAMADFGFDDNLLAVYDALSYADRNSWGKWSLNGNGNCYFKAAYKKDHGLEAWRVKGVN